MRNKEKNRYTDVDLSNHNGEDVLSSIQSTLHWYFEELKEWKMNIEKLGINENHTAKI